MKGALVENLRDEIIRGDLVPGQHLRLEEITPRLDVSTMPVQQARIPSALGALATPPPFSGVRMYFGAVMFGQRLAIAPPVGNEEGRLTITEGKNNKIRCSSGRLMATALSTTFAFGS